ncbi:MAG: hypothetical protein PUD16_02375 [bacterium]|nr:hypothetical protein [bacterium]
MRGWVRREPRRKTNEDPVRISGIPRFHYICFIVNLIAFMIMLTALDILILTDETKGRNLFYWGVIPFFASALPAYFSHWKRAPWNVIKPWPKKRKK